MNVEDIVKFGAPGLQAVSIALTAYFASRGLNAWRQQLAGKRRFDLAEEILIVAAPGSNPADHRQLAYRRLRPGLRVMPKGP